MLLRNRLPDPVPGPKLLALPMELQAFVSFRPTSLDTEYKWRHHCERTLGVHIDLVDLDAHTPSSDGLRRLHPDDDRLLRWESQGAGAEKRAEKSFFRKSVFISNDLSRSTALKTRSAEVDQAGLEAGAEAQAQAALAAAEKSFETARAVPVHATKPELTVEWSLPLLPDEDLWSNQYRYVGFDDDPAAGQGPLKRARLAEGLVVNAKNEYNPKLKDTTLTGSFIVPTRATGDGGGTSYEWQRQYSMHLEKARPGRAPL